MRHRPEKPRYCVKKSLRPDALESHDQNKGKVKNIKEESEKLRERKRKRKRNESKKTKVIKAKKKDKKKGVNFGLKKHEK